MPHVRISMTLILLLAAAGLGACTTAGPQAHQALTTGFNYYSVKQYDQSERLAATYIKDFPDDPNVDEAYYLRGLSRMGRGDAAGAAQDLNTAVMKSKRNDLKAKSYRALGDIAFDAQRWEQAIDYYNTALPFYPPAFPEPMVLFRLGAAYQDLGNWSAAKPLFDRAASLLKDPALRQRAQNRARATYFSLQFAAFNAQQSAQTEARRLQALGVRAVVVPELGDTTLLYTIRAGGFRDYATADEARRQLLTKFPTVRIAP